DLPAPPWRAKAQLDERFHHPERALELAASLEVARESDSELCTQGVVPVVVRALVAGERRVELAGPLESARERERRGCVIRGATRARREHCACDAIRDADERDHIARVVLEHGRDDRGVAFAQVVEVRIWNEPTGYVGTAPVFEDALLELL